MTILAVQNVSCSFGGLMAVDAVSFDVAEGEIFGLIGPNGAGKTTLFNIMTGLTPPSGGQIVFEGEDIARMAPHQIAARGVARTFQNIRLFGKLDALENVLIARHLHTRTNVFAGMVGLPGARRAEREARDKAMSILDRVGLGQRVHATAASLPYGDQRRLEIARALALEPRLLLLDEPAAGMNPNEKHALSDFIRQVHQDLNLTVLLIEHHVPLVMGLCDRIAVLNFGELIALGAPEAVQNDRLVIEAYLGEEK
ncbi:MAG: ABC transporter ATP-binding protein [Anaerolineales bacterium]|nr:ABC transporter ATP-binding protein [Anaerolineales bacterium]